MKAKLVCHRRVALEIFGFRCCWSRPLRCKGAMYCDEICQRRDLPRHRLTCESAEVGEDYCPVNDLICWCLEALFTKYDDEAMAPKNHCGLATMDSPARMHNYIVFLCNKCGPFLTDLLEGKREVEKCREPNFHFKAA